MNDEANIAAWKEYYEKLAAWNAYQEQQKQPQGGADASQQVWDRAYFSLLSISLSRVL